jgi:SAM-dependent methyltransferase
MRELLAQEHSPVEDMSAILDWGCGCGRMTRWWADLANTEIHGCDYNKELVAWCAANLPFAQAQRTDLEPPLPYPDAAFDLVYAFSVFTHLSIDLAEAWLTELKRIVKPGGFVWFTLHGGSYRSRLSPEQRRQFDEGEVVVWFPEIEGTNLCAAYWPDAAVPRMLGDRFEVIAHLDPQAQPARAQAAQVAPHDSYLVRRR